MKLFLISLLVFTCVSTGSFSQKVSCGKFHLQEMVEMLTLDYSHFDSRVKRKCYEFKKSDDNEFVIKKNYTSAVNANKTPDLICYGTIKPNKVFIAYNYNNPTAYKRLISELTRLNYTRSYISHPTNEMTYFYYGNGKYRISVVIYSRSNQYKYCFTIEERPMVDKQPNYY